MGSGKSTLHRKGNPWLLKNLMAWGKRALENMVETSIGHPLVRRATLISNALSSE